MVMKLKKAEEWIDNFLMSSKPYNPNPFTMEDVKKLIKQAQADTIDAAVKMCAEDAHVVHSYYTTDDKKEFNKYYYKEKWPARVDKYGIPYGVDVYKVHKENILQVADKLKKELE